MTNGRDRGVSYGFDETAVQRAAEGHGLVADQDDAALDQGAADVDQVASDADQGASERDDADASRDQRSADRDQAIADEHRAGRTGDGGDADYQSTKAARTTSRIGRLATHALRASTAGSRLGASLGRDRNAARRDHTALRREARAIQLEEAVATSQAPAREKLRRLRELAAKDRVRAAAARARASAARSDAAAERIRLETVLHGAHLDELTGVFRKEIGRHALALEIDRSRRDDGRFVLAIVDAEGLKAINLRAGDATGDRVLRTIAATMRSGLRPFDPIVRIGGDVFACGIAGMDVAEVHRRFDEIRASLYADTGVGISVGTAVLAREETFEEVLARAQTLLLEAKRARPD
jgi:diguanylate cyclase (GGDEF)-like protein